MSEAKEKDRILAQIKTFKPHNEIEGLNKHIDELVKDGYVKVWRDEQSRPIDVKLTGDGKDFLDSGGYSALIKQKVKATALKAVKWFLATVIGAALVLITNLIISQWLSK